MVALVTTILLPGLFAATGLFAAIVLVGTWRTYGGAYARLQAQLAVYDRTKAVAEQRPHQDRPAAAALGLTVLRPASVTVLRPAVSAARRVVPACALPVAA